jgi:hypothetical protein
MLHSFKLPFPIFRVSGPGRRLSFSPRAQSPAHRVIIAALHRSHGHRLRMVRAQEMPHCGGRGPKR